MRKIYIIWLAVFMQGCASLPFSDVLFPPTNTLAPSATPTITSTPTVTPSPTNTLTPTALPTIVHFPTVDPNLPTATFAPIPIIVPGGTATTSAFILPGIPGIPGTLGPGAGFLTVSVSDNKIFWGSCTPNKTRIVARVQDPDEVWSVVIFVRVKSAKKEDYTPWTTGDVMFKYPNGKFAYTLQANTTYGHNHYRNSWAIFQLVAVNVKGEEVGRTQIYKEAIAMSPCM